MATLLLPSFAAYLQKIVDLHAHLVECQTPENGIAITPPALAGFPFTFPEHKMFARVSSTNTGKQILLQGNGRVVGPSFEFVGNWDLQGFHKGTWHCDDVIATADNVRVKAPDSTSENYPVTWHADGFSYTPTPQLTVRYLLTAQVVEIHLRKDGLLLTATALRCQVAYKNLATGISAHLTRFLGNVSSIDHACFFLVNGFAMRFHDPVAHRDFTVPLTQFTELLQFHAFQKFEEWARPLPLVPNNNGSSAVNNSLQNRPVTVALPLFSIQGDQVVCDMSQFDKIRTIMNQIDWSMVKDRKNSGQNNKTGYNLKDLLAWLDVLGIHESYRFNKTTAVTMLWRLGHAYQTAAQNSVRP